MTHVDLSMLLHSRDRCAWCGTETPEGVRLYLGKVLGVPHVGDGWQCPCGAVLRFKCSLSWREVWVWERFL